MKRITTILLQALIVILGIATLAFMLWEPHLEGRNANATLFEIYFKDPFLAGAYITSIAYFLALYQAFKTLTYVRQGKTYSPETVRALRIIRNCALTLVVVVGAAVAYLFIARPEDDIAGGVAMSLFLIFGSAIVAATAQMLKRRVQKTADQLPRTT